MRLCAPGRAQPWMPEITFSAMLDTRIALRFDAVREAVAADAGELADRRQTTSVPQYQTLVSAAQAALAIWQEFANFRRYRRRIAQRWRGLDCEYIRDGLTAREDFARRRSCRRRWSAVAVYCRCRRTGTAALPRQPVNEQRGEGHIAEVESCRTRETRFRSGWRFANTVPRSHRLGDRLHDVHEAKYRLRAARADDHHRRLRLRRRVPAAAACWTCWRPALVVLHRQEISPTGRSRFPSSAVGATRLPEHCGLLDAAASARFLPASRRASSPTKAARTARRPCRALDTA